MKNQKGFTLIELIIVIVILGILAVTAAPQFINFSGDAREATTKQLQASIQNAMDLVYAKSAIQGLEKKGLTKGADNTAGTDDDGYESITEGYEVQFGYPAPTAAGLIAALNINTTEWDIAYKHDFVLNPATAIPAITDDIVIALKGANEDADDTPPVDPGTVNVDYDEIVNCYIRYLPAADKDTPPVVTFTAGPNGC